MESKESGVLITRPAGAAADLLCAAVEAAGYSAFSQPLLELHALDDIGPAQHTFIEELDLYQHVIFISGNAVRFGMSHVENYWPQLPVGISWYAIGSATAALLADFGVAAVTPGDKMTSEGLLALPALAGVELQKILIIKGQGGRDTLARELLARGAAVDELACYQRRPVDLSADDLAGKLNQWQIDTVLITSGEGLANLEVLLSPAETSNFKHLRLIVPSQRVARLAQSAGFDNIETADNASDTAMLHALKASKPSSGD
jgi:uroporphyrinogen-III synthase